MFERNNKRADRHFELHSCPRLSPWLQSEGSGYYTAETRENADITSVTGDKWKEFPGRTII